MSKDKYVIANCPALFNTPDGKFKNDCCDKPGSSPCKDCTDCILKQIVELCKPLNTKRPESYYNLEVLLAKKILQLLDIREVE